MHDQRRCWDDRNLWAMVWTWWWRCDWLSETRFERAKSAWFQMYSAGSSCPLLSASIDSWRCIVNSKVRCRYYGGTSMVSEHVNNATEYNVVPTIRSRVFISQGLPSSKLPINTFSRRGRYRTINQPLHTHVRLLRVQDHPRWANHDKGIVRPMHHTKNRGMKSGWLYRRSLVANLFYLV